ncbi:MAG: hypothetical protein QM754_15300 [Tepidisphaeraceae bacterium]
MSRSRIAIASAAVAAALSFGSFARAADAPATAAEDEKPNIHGFFEVPFKTAYITPRGLVVENQGLVIQPIGGLVIPLTNDFTFIGGVWNSFNTHQNDPEVNSYNEIDPFATLSYKFDQWEFSGTYVAFISPAGDYETEHNIEFAAKYSDKWFDGFSINPYAKFFWAVSGDSTVVLGRKGDTFDVEIGAVPTMKFLESSKYPVTLTVPTFFTVGPKNFWGGDQNFGVFSTGVNAQVPLTFIPKRYGDWHASVGVNYYYLINDNLQDAAELLGSGDDRNRFVGSISIGMSF